MKIRKAITEDAAEIANVHINSWREAYKGLLPQTFLDDRPLYFKNRYELWKRVTADQSHATYVAESDNSGVVGFINGYTARDKGYEDFAEVYCIYLLQKFHGQKIGFRLLKIYFDALLEKGYKKGYLWVLKDNPTIRFYESTGAKLVHDIKKTVIGGLDVEELCYVWDNINLDQK